VSENVTATHPISSNPGLKQQQISLQFDAIVARLPLTDPSTVQPAILAKLCSINTKSCADISDNGQKTYKYQIDLAFYSLQYIHPSIESTLGWFGPDCAR